MNGVKAEQESAIAVADAARVKEDGAAQVLVHLGQYIAHDADERSLCLSSRSISVSRHFRRLNAHEGQVSRVTVNFKLGKNLKRLLFDGAILSSHLNAEACEDLTILQLQLVELSDSHHGVADAVVLGEETSRDIFESLVKTRFRNVNRVGTAHSGTVHAGVSQTETDGSAIREVTVRDGIANLIWTCRIFTRKQLIESLGQRLIDDARDVVSEDATLLLFL